MASVFAGDQVFIFLSDPEAEQSIITECPEGGEVIASDGKTCLPPMENI